jgi:hypothetical protein
MLLLSDLFGVSVVCSDGGVGLRHAAVRADVFERSGRSGSEDVAGKDHAFGCSFAGAAACKAVSSID